MRVATFDIETNGFLPELDRIWCAAVKEHGQDQVVTFDPRNIHELPKYLEQFDVLIGHNAIQFDFPALRKVYGWEYKGKKVDTLLISRLQRPTRRWPPHAKGRGKSGPHSVQAWGWRVGRGKVVHEEWDRFTPEMLHRCSEDVEIQCLIYAELLKEGRGEGWTAAHKLNFKLFENLQNQEEYGWYVDQVHIDRCLYVLERWIGLIDRAVAPYLPLRIEVQESKKEGQYNYIKKPFKQDGHYSAAVTKWLSDKPGINIAGPFSRVWFRPTDLNSNMEVKAFLLEAGWQPAEWNTNNDGERTSPKLSKDDPFEGINGALGRLVARRVQCRQRKSIIEGWRELVREDGRIPSRVVGLAATGRARHTNIVNVPSPHSKAFFAKWMRQIFTTQPGWVLVGVDSKGNQIRQLAARMGDKEFTHAVLHGNQEDGTDLHSLNQKRSGAPSRSRAKNFFYGFIFGAGDEKIGKVIDGDAAAGRKLRETYLNELPALRTLIDNLTTEWRRTAKKWYNKKWGRMEYSDGWIKGLDGRPILVESPHKLLCYTLQSDEAIQMAAAYNIWHKWMNERWPYRKMWGTVIWMHDEWQFECVPEIAEEAAMLACAAIKWAGAYYKIACPHDGDYQIGRNWYETH
ncbi:MAG TPA: DNA polymerase [Mariprofundaceae bacterium]|nr:DNA polymerase [Mariprofundaceae bacterium]